jgi:hypothetical protein
LPLTVATAVVFALALVPGAFGSYAWAALNGLDWRQRDWESAIRFIAFSAVGLALYSIVAASVHLAPAIHVIPATYAAPSFAASDLPKILLPYIGHIACAGIVGACAALGDRAVSAATGAAPQVSTWDYFLEQSAPGRWVVITLKSGDVFAGFIRTAEHSAPTNERDIVLASPARFDTTRSSYVVTNYRDIFIPAELVQNVATVREDADLAIVPKPGSALFTGA